jgi:hypothetical protein
MSKFLMRGRFNHDQNPDVENFDSKLQDQSIPESERLIPMWSRFDHDQNHDIEIFDATQN